MLVLMVLMATAEALGVLSIMPFLSVLGRPAIVSENPQLSAVYSALGFESTRQFTIALALASISLVVATSAFKIVALHNLNRFVHMLRHAISTRLLSRYLHQPYEFFLTRNSAVLGKNVLSEVDQLMFHLVQPLSQLMAQGCVVLAMVALVFYYDPVTALCIVAVVSALYGAIYWLARERLKTIGHERAAANGKRYQICSEALAGIKDVKITQSADAYLQQFSSASRRVSRSMAASDTLSQSPLYLVEATGYTVLIAIALVLLSRSNDIALVLPALGLYGFAAYRMLPATQVLYRGFAKLKFSSAALQSIHADLSRSQEDAHHAGGALAPMKEIRFDEVGYSYPTSDRPVLDRFNLTIPARACIGIVGASGAGKSTVLDLLLGLLQPQAGAITVDGVPITPQNVGAWQRAIGYVPQHIYLADTTVAENIALGVAPEKIDMHAVERSARIAQIHNYVVNELPDGYNTRIGDRGTRLSGGQRQRIGIARALYRDPAVLVFDEATSALDPATELAVNNAIAAISGQKTVVVVAHKGTSLQGCDHIVSLGPQSETATT